MAIVTTSWPRSDIYQLFDRMTVLFFGEVIYSGYTKQMPVYFRQIGYPCPASENPAIYYCMFCCVETGNCMCCIHLVSLATVDRETSERYLETQEQAVKLIEIFKGQGEPFSLYNGRAINDIYSQSHHVPLSHLGNPSGISRMFTLTQFVWVILFCLIDFRRTLSTYFDNGCHDLLTRLFAMPFFALILLFFYWQLDEHSNGAPQTRSGLMFNTMCLAGIIAPFVSTITGKILCVKPSIFSIISSSTLLSRIMGQCIWWCYISLFTIHG